MRSLNMKFCRVYWLFFALLAVFICSGCSKKKKNDEVPGGGRCNLDPHWKGPGYGDWYMRRSHAPEPVPTTKSLK